VEWYQRFPFNHLVKNKQGCTNAPAGCVAVATAQIMAYWGWPSSIDYYTLNWPYLRIFTGRDGIYPIVWHKRVYFNEGNFTQAKDTIPGLTYDNLFEHHLIDMYEQNFVSQASRLMELIGEHVYMNYTNTNSSASSWDAIDYLRQVGYQADNSMDYNCDTIISSLKSERPVYIRGSSIAGGHAWVIDGWLKQKQSIIVDMKYYCVTSNPPHWITVPHTTACSYTDYFHNNWGWNGVGNGYFVAGDFYRKNIKFDSNAEEPESIPAADERYNYQSGKTIWTNIKH